MSIKLEDWERDSLIWDIKDATRYTIHMHECIKEGYPDTACIYAKYAFQDWKRVLSRLEVE